MYLHRIIAQNFRAFGDGTNSPALDLQLNPGMNILIGENDAGKTGIVDAIRQVLWTTSFDTIRIFEHDFHVHGADRAASLVIEATLKGLTPGQEAAVLEWLTYETDGSTSLIVNLHARLHPAQAKRRTRVETIVRSGRNGSGPEIGFAARELIRATYLRPLRDAEAELKPGRMSRLSQILAAHTQMDGQDENDFDAMDPSCVPESLVGLMAQAQHHIGEHSVVKAVQKDINENYLGRMSFAGDELAAEIRLASDLALTPILERFELALLPPGDPTSVGRHRRGLGYNNALFMATELVLLRDGEELALLLVEEPEAHLHPQLQSRVMDLLEQHANSSERPVQVIMTTHSPSLAAGSAIDEMILVHRAKTFPLRVGETRLGKSDYQFLRRFVDATKANLFFSRGVAVVEGPAEALLLPAIAAAAGLSFSKFGVSVVNVGSVGLYHYARIFQRAVPSEEIPIPVACITDRDIVPDLATYVAKPVTGKRFEADYTEAEAKALVARKVARVETPTSSNVKVFVADHWTLEYDLAHSGLAEMMHCAIALAVKAKSRDERLNEEDEADTLATAVAAWPAIKAAAASDEALAVQIYQPLQEKKASKAIAAEYAAGLLLTGRFGTGMVILQSLPSYLRAALEHLTSGPRVAEPAAEGASV